MPRHQPLDAEVRRDVVLVKNRVVQLRVGSSKQRRDELHGVQQVDRGGSRAVAEVVERQAFHRRRGERLVFEHHEHHPGDAVKALEVIYASRIGAVLRVDGSCDDPS